jgi:hypothetical protein
MATDIPTQLLFADVQTNPSLATEDRIGYRQENGVNRAVKPMSAKFFPDP